MTINDGYQNFDSFVLVFKKFATSTNDLLEQLFLGLKKFLR
jgi:hypothetical protein